MQLYLQCEQNVLVLFSKDNYQYQMIEITHLIIKKIAPQSILICNIRKERKSKCNTIKQQAQLRAEADRLGCSSSTDV